jgi:NAD(P)-dependent dehydrogenase (short-subunit alcohol dehydrogenase family)
VTQETQTGYLRTLSGKRIMVLGGTSGIGFATADMAASEGAAVVIASSKREHVDRAVARLPEGAEGYAVDLSDEAQMRDFFAQLGAFDHLAFTAGERVPLGPGELGETNLEQARHAFDLRFWGALMAASYGSRQIRPGGSIVLTSGIVGRRPRKGQAVAAAILGAVEALTRALAIELAPIRINAVCPGAVRTEMWTSMPKTAREATFQAIGQSLPVGRVGEAHDLAQAYLYLMREGYSTGQVIVVDGGMTLV